MSYEICLQAIANPQSAESQEKAWQAVVPIVLQLKRYYEFSVALGRFLLVLACHFICHKYFLYIQLGITVFHRLRNFQPSCGICCFATEMSQATELMLFHRICQISADTLQNVCFLAV